MRYDMKWHQYENKVLQYHTIPTTGTLFEENSPNTQIDSSVVYAGTSVTECSDAGTVNWDNDYLTGNYGGINFGKVNFRMCCQFGNSNIDLFRYGLKYTGLNELQVRYYEVDDESQYSLDDPLKVNYSNVPTISNGFCHQYLTFINSLSVNDLILLPYFSVITYTLYNYRGGTESQDYIDGVGNYYSNIRIDSREVFTWSQIKNEDNTQAGEHYDQELFENGYKLISSDLDSVTYKVVTGVKIIAIYGKSSKVYDGNTDTYTDDLSFPTRYGDRVNITSDLSDNYPIFNNRGRRVNNFFIINEGFYNGSIYYYNTPGIIWVPNNSAIDLINYQTGEYQPQSNGLKMNSSYYNTVNSYYSNTSYGGIIVQNTAESAVPTGNVICTGLPSLMGNFFDNTNLAYGNTSTSVYRYIDNLSNGHNPILNAYRKSFRQYNGQGCYFSIKDLWKKIACYGLYVADSDTAARKASLGKKIGNNNHIYLGEMLADGTTTGRMLQGSEIADSIQSNIDDIISETPYTPITPGGGGDDGIDDNDKGTGTNLPNFGLKLAGSGGFTSYYLLSYQGLASVQNALSVVASTFWEALGTATDYSQSNLLKYVMSLKWYPIDILTGNQGVYADVATTEINFAFNQNSKLPITGVNYKLGSTLRVYNMGSIAIPYKLNFETFLDKDPYTSVTIWLPFCGLYPLKADYVVGNTINIYYVVDLTTGMCTAIVTNDRNTLLNVTGKIGVDYAVTGNDVITQSERMAGSYVNGAMSAINGAISLGSAAMSENIAGAISASVGLAGSIAKSSIDIASAKRAVPVAVSSGSGFGSCFAPNAPAIIVNPPAVKIPSDYGHTTGYVYNQIAVIGSLSGFVVCNNPDLTSIKCTEAEKSEIYRRMTTGFYV